MGSVDNIVLRVDGLGQSFRPALRGWFRKDPELRPLSNMSFVLKAGESLGIVGTNGSGKSTLLRLILGTAKPEMGRIYVLGKDLALLSKAERRALLSQIRHISCDTIAQLPGQKTPYDIVTAALSATGLKDPDVKKARVVEALRLVGVGHADADCPTSTLSASLQHRVAIAETIVVRPQLIIVDELGRGMDLSVQALMHELLLEIQDKMQLSLIVSCSNLSVAGSACDELLVLKDGEVVDAGSAHRVLSQPGHKHTHYLLSQSRVAESVA